MVFRREHMLRTRETLLFFFFFKQNKDFQMLVYCLEQDQENEI